MKLPKEDNLYKLNEGIDKLHDWASLFRMEYTRTKHKSSVWQTCQENLRIIRNMHDVISYLELAIDEVLKVPGVSDDK